MKMNRKLRNALVLMCSAILLVCLSVGATLAYLTSKTDIVKNTFTVGGIQIDLDEAAVEYDEETNHWVAQTERVKENEYELKPGTLVDKDPTVTVKAESENCYVRAMITLSYPIAAEAFLSDTWILGRGNEWTFAVPTTTKTETTVTRVYEVRYNNIVKYNETQDQVLQDIFQQIQIPGDLNNDQIALLEDLTIDVVAHAIQSDGFATADLAWQAW